MIIEESSCILSMHNIPIDQKQNNQYINNFMTNYPNMFMVFKTEEHTQLNIIFNSSTSLPIVVMSIL